jgi:hypothetical protein
MYSLTGMMSSTIPMQLPSQSNSEEWLEKLAFLKDTLSDEHYQKQDIILTCFNEPAQRNINNNSSRFSGGSPSGSKHNKNSLGPLQEE